MVDPVTNMAPAYNAMSPASEARRARKAAERKANPRRTRAQLLADVRRDSPGATRNGALVKAARRAERDRRAA